jgi:hypothetical protein
LSTTKFLAIQKHKDSNKKESTMTPQGIVAPVQPPAESTMSVETEEWVWVMMPQGGCGVTKEYKTMDLEQSKLKEAMPQGVAEPEEHEGSNSKTMERTKPKTKEDWVWVRRCMGKVEVWK